MRRSAGSTRSSPAARPKRVTHGPLTTVEVGSLPEGFGLTVAEAMWKSRPVVASRLGGIQDQIEHGISGLMLDDPSDLPAFGRAVIGLLGAPVAAAAMGAAAAARVRGRFLAPHSLLGYFDLLSELLGERPNTGPRTLLTSPKPRTGELKWRKPAATEAPASSTLG